MDMIRSLVGTTHPDCQHMPETVATPAGQSCAECGSTYSLRMCTTCGHVGCCESQAGDAEAHFRESGHEVMASMPVGRGFMWCYTDRKYVG
jgi:CPA1 family monovalent cation:H+ antiporter